MLSRDVITRITKIREGDCPMVVARSGEDFEIGYSDTVWGHNIKQSDRFIGQFDHTTELEQISSALRRVKK